MATLTNLHKAPLGLPSGLVLEPGVSTDDPNWGRNGANRVVQAWIRARLLRVERLPEATPASVVVDADKDALIAELATFGIRKDRRSTVENLRKLLEQAKADSEAEQDE